MIRSPFGATRPRTGVRASGRAFNAIRPLRDSVGGVPSTGEIAADVHAAILSRHDRVDASAGPRRERCHSSLSSLCDVLRPVPHSRGRTCRRCGVPSESNANERTSAVSFAVATRTVRSIQRDTPEGVWPICPAQIAPISRSVSPYTAESRYRISSSRPIPPARHGSGNERVV